jgi:hypothetical protein
VRTTTSNQIIEKTASLVQDIHFITLLAKARRKGTHVIKIEGITQGLDRCILSMVSEYRFELNTASMRPPSDIFLRCPSRMMRMTAMMMKTADKQCQMVQNIRIGKLVGLTA